MTTGSVLAHYRGDDTYALDRAAAAVVERVAEQSGAPPERWRVTGAETTLAAIAERVATAPLFGGGTVAIVSDPAPLLRSKTDRDAFVALLGTVAPGNGLVVLEPGDGSGRRSAALESLRVAIEAAGGETREFRAPKEGQLAGWIEARARELGLRLAPGAAKELARRVGGFVREGDVDRRGQGALAVAELEKLALYRAAEPIRAEDVEALTAEVVPDSTWALLDAIAARDVRTAAPILDRLLATTPEPVLLVAIHRRLRDVLEVADHLAAGATPASLVRTLKLKPFRAERLAAQARAWALPELDAALEGLLELDARVKGAPGSGSSDRQRRLAFALWLEERVARRAR